jgi:hypothetical protein
MLVIALGIGIFKSVVSVFTARNNMNSSPIDPKLYILDQKKRSSKMDLNLFGLKCMKQLKAILY